MLQNCERALDSFNVKSISLVGGVAANEYLREKLSTLAERHNKKFVVPGLEFCGDNAAMIAFRAKTLYEKGVRDSLNAKPYPSLKKNHFLSPQNI